MKRSYELVFIINPELAEKERKGLVEKIKGIVKRFQGQILSIEEWGKRNLAYTIQKFMEGYYVQINFNGPSQTVKEVERALKLDEMILRYQTILLEDVDG